MNVAEKHVPIVTESFFFFAFSEFYVDSSCDFKYSYHLPRSCVYRRGRLGFQRVWIVSVGVVEQQSSKQTTWHSSL